MTFRKPEKKLTYTKTPWGPRKYVSPKTEKRASCLAEGCDRPPYRVHRCSLHYSKYRSGDDSPIRAGSVNKDGYVVRVVPLRGSVLEHRLVMEQSIGRWLLSHETVHHKNGVRSDNRLENLELWISAHPPGQRVEDVVAWAVSILSLYAPERLAASQRGASYV